MSLYAVVLYSDYRKENDWRIQQIFDDEKEALDYAKKWSRPEKGDYYVTPNKKGEQKVLLDQTCDVVSEDEYYQLHPEATEYNPEPEDPEGPYKGMSWGRSCRLAVVKIPFKKIHE